MVYDRGTKWLDCFPVPDKTGDEAYEALNQLAGPKDNVLYFYIDNAPEHMKAARDLGWKPGTSTPGRPETNGVAEAAVKRVTRNTTSVLDQAGLTPEWWPMAARHYRFSQNIVGKGESPFNARHGSNFSGKIIPLGALVEFRPSNTRESAPKFSTKSTPGIFLGYHLLPGGKWKGDYLVSELEEFRKGKTPGNISTQRVQEVAITHKWFFPLKKQYEQSRNIG